MKLNKLAPKIFTVIVVLMMIIGLAYSLIGGL